MCIRDSLIALSQHIAGLVDAVIGDLGDVDHRIDKPSDVLAEGDKVDVKITDVDMENKKISLSIRALLEEMCIRDRKWAVSR